MTKKVPDEKMNESTQVTEKGGSLLFQENISFSFDESQFWDFSVTMFFFYFYLHVKEQQQQQQQ